VHLANGSDDDTPYGASILDGGALALQDQINAIQHDITAAALLNGSPQTYSKGFALPKDEDQRPIPVRTGPGYHHHADDPNAAFGIIEPGDLTQLKSAYLTKIEAITRITNTPIHTITGEWPSGEAIFRAEMPIVQDTRKLAETLGPSMATVMHRSTEMKNTFGTGPELDESALIRTVFEPPEMRDALSVWMIAEKASAFVSTREVLRLAGYTPDQIEQIMEERADEKAESISFAQAAFSRPPEMDALLRASGASLADAPNPDDAPAEIGAGA